MGTCKVTVDQRKLLIRENYYGRHKTLTIIGFPNRSQNFRANNPSDVFNSKYLCTIQECFFPNMIRKRNGIDELGIRQKNLPTAGAVESLGLGRSIDSIDETDRECESVRPPTDQNSCTRTVF